MPTRYSGSDHRAWSKGRPRLAALTAALLLLMQAIVLEHQLNPDHHHGDAPCELCLHLTPLDPGLVNTAPGAHTASPPLLSASPLLPGVLPEYINAYHSRGPPITS